MESSVKILGLCAVAGLAYLAGQSNLVSPNSSAAYAQEGHEGHDHDGADYEEDSGMEATPLGKHHKYLDKLVGTWEGTVKIWMEPDTEPMVMPGTVTRTWILDGHYLEEKIESHSAMGRFQGLGHWGYNTQDGRYEFTWMDSMSTAIMTGTGSYNPDTQVFSTSSSHRDPMTGRMIDMRGRADVSNSDRHVFIDYSTDENGREFKFFEGIYERVEEN